MSTSIIIEPELYTEADLESFSLDSQRFELWHGELVPMVPAGGLHGSITSHLSTHFAMRVLEHDLGECFAAGTGFRIEENPPTVLAPDFAFISRTRVPKPLPEGFVPVAPDLVLETRSPGDTARAVAEKIDLWLEAGVRVVWELNPRRRVLTVYRPNAETHRLTENDTLECPELLPGFSLALNLIYQS